MTRRRTRPLSVGLVAVLLGLASSAQAQRGVQGFRVEPDAVNENGAGSFNTAHARVTLGRCVHAAGCLVMVTTMDQTAISGGSVQREDYLQRQETLYFPFSVFPQEQFFSITIRGDDFVELDETFLVELSNPGGAPIDAGFGEATITILNDDFGQARLAVVDPSKPEGQSNTVPVLLTKSADVDVVVHLEIVDLTTEGAADYSYSHSLDVPFLAFDATPFEPRNYLLLQEDLVELDEVFRIQITGVSAEGRSYEISSTQGSVDLVIENDDAAVVECPPALVQGSEGDAPQTVDFPMMLLDPVDATVTVDWQTVAGDATPGEDYVEASGQVTFSGAAGEQQTFPLEILGDEVVELHEDLELHYSNVQAGARPVTLDCTDSTVRLWNDDQAALAITDVEGLEGDSGTTVFQFTVSLDHEVDNQVDVDFTTVDGTATASGADYLPEASFLSFTQPGDLTIEVEVLGDQVPEGDEEFLVALSDIDAGERAVFFADDSGTGTILGDDGQPIFSDGFESGDVSAWSATVP